MILLSPLFPTPPRAISNLRATLSLLPPVASFRLWARFNLQVRVRGC